MRGKTWRRGTGQIERSCAHANRRRQRPIAARRFVFVVDQNALGLDVRIEEQLIHMPYLGHRHFVLAQQDDPVGTAALNQQRLELGAELHRVGVGNRGGDAGRHGQTPPGRRAAGAQRNAAVGRGEHAIMGSMGRRIRAQVTPNLFDVVVRRMLFAQGRQLLVHELMPPLVVAVDMRQRVVLDRKCAAQQRRLHTLAHAGALAGIERRADAAEQQHRGGVVGDLDLAVKSQPLLLGGERIHQSRARLHDYVHARQRRLRSDLTVGRHCTVDDRRVDRGNRVVVEPAAFDRGWAKIHEHHIRDLDQRAHHGRRLGMTQIDGDAFLAPILDQEWTGLAGGELIGP